jgi:hypothetical protein
MEKKLMSRKQVTDAELIALCQVMDRQAEEIASLGKRAVDAGTERDVTDRELMALAQHQAAFGFMLANLITRRELERQSREMQAELVEQHVRINGSL